ncbi:MULTISPECIES: PTS sugar transporter subunit IIA [Aerococcus]|uniref:PTS sugar transporter subunit IIA n=1 Tax=Aerococcus TaxID=1375 RepID=UPI000DCC353D|nr:PTS sugar transporter subunit IIA [Aerococcus urinae]RAV93826.1 PTS sugar transporter subunit IIA [Aerococcus mictus]MDK6375283.1 PTS sugar transporter subunit IIA [Aerococcus urinae]MDK6420131.1 PTS sugar transporter subunit IIA [Aerococcus urinae]MDK8075624.1 PTS sugar transporter subunit IIA [Aerococcus urinae]MDK8084607.1 PTS sugar transporter subunit IIA [Aerococcus urinae]
MIGILIITHGHLASGLISAINLIAGEVDNLDYLELYQETNVDDFTEEVKKKVRQLDQGEGVAIFSDLVGATPYNSTAKIYQEISSEVSYRSIAGVNLPMLLDCIFSRETMSLHELTDHLLLVGKDSVKELFNEVNGGKNNG